MRLPARTRPETALPGLRGTARVDRRTEAVLARLRPGDIAVLDHVDLDRATAQALLDAGVAAVLNRGPFISGRYPNLGPELLCAAGVHLVDGIGDQGSPHLRDGVTLRVDGGRVFVGESAEGGGAEPVAVGRAVESATIREDLALARLGMAAQLDTFTHNATEFLRREHDLLLDGDGLPRLSTSMRGRPAVVVVDGPECEAELRHIGAYLSEQRPVLIAVDRAAEVLRRAGHRPDVVVLDARGELPSGSALTPARDVVVRIEPGGDRSRLEQLERLGVRAVRLESTAATEDAALLLADAGEAEVIVGVGLHATLVDFLDRQRAGLASTYLTRLKLGPRLVDATAVPRLYSGRVRPRHLMLVMLAGLIALSAAVSVTPVGQEWAETATAALADLYDSLHGLL
ncbi:putative cytokinetic ring protein SteA [Nocardioides ferulae]|uniref:putative cytokinetic ring protein SteA n=1 Tax=Nocardioides ferulae TaxID=2340821 RepID=UPI000EAC677E|nr:putative cytokinetic ring protein SteA [Nocardioides ferulae]